MYQTIGNSIILISSCFLTLRILRFFILMLWNFNCFHWRFSYFHWRFNLGIRSYLTDFFILLIFYSIDFYSFRSFFRNYWLNHIINILCLFIVLFPLYLFFMILFKPSSFWFIFLKSSLIWLVTWIIFISLMMSFFFLTLEYIQSNCNYQQDSKNSYNPFEESFSSSSAFSERFH